MNGNYHWLMCIMGCLPLCFNWGYANKIPCPVVCCNIPHEICTWPGFHYDDVIMSAIASQITCLTSVYSGADQRKHQSPTSLAFVRGIHQSLVNSPHKGPLTRKMFPFDDVIMLCFVVLIVTLIIGYMSSFTHIHQGYFTGTGAIIWLPLGQSYDCPSAGWVNTVGSCYNMVQHNNILLMT